MAEIAFKVTTKEAYDNSYIKRDIYYYLTDLNKVYRNKQDITFKFIILKEEDEFTKSYESSYKIQYKPSTGEARVYNQSDYIILSQPTMTDSSDIYSTDSVNTMQMINYVDTTLSNFTPVATSKYEVVDTLPENDIDTNVTYLVEKEDPNSNDIYDEWIYINNKWELVGSGIHADVKELVTKLELNNIILSLTNSIETTYVKKEDINDIINDADLITKDDIINLYNSL